MITLKESKEKTPEILQEINTSSVDIALPQGFVKIPESENKCRRWQV